MVTDDSEKALENLIEASLLAADGDDGPTEYRKGDPKDFDPERALDTAMFWRFLEETQGTELDKLRARHDWQRLVQERLDRKISKDGLLSVLKKGLRIDDAHLHLLYRLPYNTLTREAERRFEANIFSVTRQVRFSTANPTASVDMVLFVNGLPVVTMELKQPGKNQTVHDARKQYQDRDPREALFQFGRCLVHFAVDTDDAAMATRLSGKSTYFLPFNKGDSHGKGNPVNPHGYKTAFLWENVLTRRSLTNIIEHFAKMVEEEDPDTGAKKKTLFFPRYHQMDVVRRVLTDVRERGVGHRYLIQHSAGSGKSNSITWLGYQLVELYDQAGKANLFDSVIVVTDRRVLDRQIKDNIRNFSEVKNVVAHAYNSQELKAALENGKKLIITTIQKFPFIVDGIADLSERKFAVIIDEAHSSQSGSASDNLNQAIGGAGNDEEPEDFQDMILSAMERRRMGDNASFFAFTATPKNATLERFGRRAEDGKFYPFHLYSMKQAIEEGFILDVLKNYTTYRSYYELQKSVAENPEFDTTKAQSKLRSYVEAHPDTIATKAAIMLDHFANSVVRPKKLKGKAKAMVVTRNIESAIRYFLTIRQILADRGAPYQAIVAFTGKKLVDGIEHTEDSLNGFAGNDIPKTFKTDQYRILVVANKFLTGFDEPMLSTMYVDKKLQGVLAVQALSRLNRCNNKLAKDDTFVLDFYNSVDDIKNAFDPFYTSTALSEPTDVNVLHDLKETLDDRGVYDWHEVEAFSRRFFASEEAETIAPILDAVAGRFDDLTDEDKADTKIKAKQFVKIYAQVACIIPFSNAEWEMLHWFLKFLIPKMRVRDKEGEEIDEILESVDLTTYGLERVKLGYAIELDSSASEVDPPNPNPRGAHGGDDDKDPLDLIIAAFNERYFTGWDATPEEQRVKLVNIARKVMDDPAFVEKVMKNADEQNRRIAGDALIEKAIRNERRRELEMYRKYASDSGFSQGLHAAIQRIIDHALKEGWSRAGERANGR